MSQSVSRLKELLFDTEERRLAELAQRLDALVQQESAARAALEEAMRAHLAAAREEYARSLATTTTSVEALERDTADLRRTTDSLAEVAATPERLERSVAGVIDGVLRRAESEQHIPVSDALAPLVLRTIKSEIRNSREEIAEVLYPMTGRMVKAYIASAMKDLVRQINRRLESNPLMLRLRALASGRSPAEIAMADSQRLAPEELFLIRRGSGELIARWPDDPAEPLGQDQVMSGVLTAINDFSTEAFNEPGTALRQIDLGTGLVYLRASPTHLLAVKCSGAAQPGLEEIIDDMFLVAIAKHQDLLSAYPSATPPTSEQSAILSDLNKQLAERIEARQDELARPLFGITPVQMLATIIGVPLALGLAWLALDAWQTSRVRTIAETTLEASADMKGYPVGMRVSSWGRGVTLWGLAPTETARDNLIQQLNRALPQTRVDSDLTIMPTHGVDTRPQIAVVRTGLARLEAESARIRSQAELARAETARAAVLRSLQRAKTRLDEALPDLRALSASLTAGKSRQDAEAAQQTLEAALEAVATHTATLSASVPPPPTDSQGATAAALDTWSVRLRLAANRIASAIGAPRPEPAAAVAAPANDLQRSAEEFAAQSERIAALTIAAHQVALLAQRQAPAPSRGPRELLDSFIKTNAIFFGNASDYRNEDRAAAQLDTAATLIRAAGATIRVVGFTDEQGSPARNSQVAQDRANRVAAELGKRGVPTTQLIVLARPNTGNLSPASGPSSPNRRVELQLAFDGEQAE